MSASKLHYLIELAEETSSARRRELLRELTDLFLVTSEPRPAAESALFDGVMTQIAGDMEAAVRAELAMRLSKSAQGPAGLLGDLAHDDIAVAGPILSNANGLSDADQLRIAATRGQSHLGALSRRPGLSTAVSDVIVERGDDTVLDSLLRNPTANMSRQAEEKAISRAQENKALHDAVVNRASLPADLLNEMYFIVESRLRDRILARNASLDPAELNAALEAGRDRVAVNDGALPRDYEEAQTAVAAIARRGGLTPPVLAAMLRNGQTTHFLVALSQLANLDFQTARRIIESRQLDALAVVCKAANFDRALFLTFAVLVLGREEDAMGRAREYGETYSRLSAEAAGRTMRFWRLRRSEAVTAAA